MNDIEAVRPKLRELHFKDKHKGGLPDLCHECRKQWPCRTAELIYPPEEIYELERLKAEVAALRDQLARVGGM